MFYEAVDTSKQAIHQMLERRMGRTEIMGYLSVLLVQIRADHPTLSCRAMYFKLQPSNIGRDAFEQVCRDLGFSVVRKPNYHRTTDSSGVIRFDNLLVSLVLDGINQAWP